MPNEPLDPILAHLVAKLPKGKQRKKLMVFLPLLAEIHALNRPTSPSPSDMVKPQ